MHNERSNPGLKPAVLATENMNMVRGWAGPSVSIDPEPRRIERVAAPDHELDLADRWGVGKRIARDDDYVGELVGLDCPELRGPSKPFTAARDGFSLNAGVACEAHERAKLERLCRYVCRPAIAEQRLGIDGDGLVVYELKRAFSDGTTHVLFEPHDFIARLAALVPRPRGHLIRYHGLFAPNARHRQTIVAAQRCQSTAKQAEATTDVPRAPMSWMARLKHVFDIDLSQCPNCGARLRVIGEVTDPNVIARILEHVQARGSRVGLLYS